jgi:hypothetical protein
MTAETHKTSPTRKTSGYSYFAEFFGIALFVPSFLELFLPTSAIELLRGRKIEFNSPEHTMLFIKQVIFCFLGILIIANARLKRIQKALEEIRDKE